MGKLKSESSRGRQQLDSLKDGVKKLGTKRAYELHQQPTTAETMLDSETASFVVAVAGIVLVSTSSIPAFCDLFHRLRSSSRGRKARDGPNGNSGTSRNGSGEYSLLQDLYEDCDGHATKESLQGFSDRIHLIFVSILSASGFLLSLVLGVVVTLDSSKRLSLSSPSSPWLIEQWLQFGIWVRSFSILLAQYRTSPHCIPKYRKSYYRI